MTDSEALQSYLDGEIDLSDLAADPALYAQVARALRGRTLPGIIEAARTFAGRPAGTLPIGMGQPELSRLGDLIARALADGQHPYQTARAMDMVTALDPQRQARLVKYLENLATTQPNLSDAEFQKRTARMADILLNDRKRVIAQTEQAYAQGGGRLLEAKARGKQWKRSISTGDSRVSDICLACEGQGWIPIEEVFASGNDSVPHHVRCRCTVAYKQDAPDAASEERARRYHEQTVKARENKG